MVKSVDIQCAIAASKLDRMRQDGEWQSYLEGLAYDLLLSNENLVLLCEEMALLCDAAIRRERPLGEIMRLFTEAAGRCQETIAVIRRIQPPEDVARCLEVAYEQKAA